MVQCYGPLTVVAVMQLYLDDSGTRHPDRKPSSALHGYDWFGLGGVMLRQLDEEAVRSRHAAFCEKWSVSAPLHSSEIRSKSKAFRWLKNLKPDKHSAFMTDLGVLATATEFTAIACVIDRPGYNHRYAAKYGQNRWSLCKTAFHIVVERGAKFARDHGCKLRVLVEKSDPKTDRMLEGYYDSLRNDGLPFDQSVSSKYAPLTAGEFRETLYEYRTKNKTSPVMQLADLCLWPMCIGGYDRENRAISAMRDAGILIDCKISRTDLPTRGIKYSCWDLRSVPKMDNAQSPD